jgi:hypothetical protein
MSKVMNGRMVCGYEGELVPHWERDGPQEYVPAEIADKLLAACQAAMKAAVEVGMEHGNYSLAKQLESVISEATKE